MQISAQMHAKNEEIKQLPIIVELMKETDNLKDGQADIKKVQAEIKKMIEDDRVSTQESFEKGIIRFREIEDKVDAMELTIEKGFKKLEKQLSDHLVQADKDEIKKLNEKLKNVDYVKNGIIIALVATILGSFVSGVIESYITSKVDDVQRVVQIKD